MKAMILIVVLLCCVNTGQATESVVLEIPFEQVVAYMNDSFHTNLPSVKLCWVQGPSFMSTGKVYYVRTEKYVPDNIFVFVVHFGSIGFERSKFVLQKLKTKKTSVSLTRKAEFIFPLPTEKIERRIIRAFQDSIKIWQEEKGATEGVNDSPE